MKYDGSLYLTSQLFNFHRKMVLTYIILAIEVLFDNYALVLQLQSLPLYSVLPMRMIM
jgi:hypothetical protein